MPVTVTKTAVPSTRSAESSHRRCMDEMDNHSTLHGFSGDEFGRRTDA